MIIPSHLGAGALGPIAPAAPSYATQTISPAEMAAIQAAHTAAIQDDYLDPNKAYVRVGPFIFEATPTDSIWGWHNVYTNPLHFSGQDMSWLANILKTSFEVDGKGKTLPTNRGTFWNAGGTTPINPPGIPLIGANSRIPTQQWPQDYLDQYRAWMTALGVGASDYYLPYLSTMHGVGLIYLPNATPGSQNWVEGDHCFGNLNRWRQIWYGEPVGQLLNPADNQQYVLSIGLGATDGAQWDATRRCWYNTCTQTCDTNKRTMALYAWWVKVVPANKSWWDSVKDGLTDLIQDACWLVNQQWVQYTVEAAVTAESGASATAATHAGFTLAQKACNAAFASSTTPPPVPAVTAVPPPPPGHPTTTSTTQRFPATCIKRFNTTHNTWRVYCPPGVSAYPTAYDTSKLKISAATLQRFQSGALTRQTGFGFQSMGPISTTAPKQLAPSVAAQTAVTPDTGPRDMSVAPGGATAPPSTTSTTCAADETFDAAQNACVPATSPACGPGLMLDPATNACVAITAPTPFYKKPVTWAIAGGVGVALIGGLFYFRSRATKPVAGRSRR